MTARKVVTPMVSNPRHNKSEIPLKKKSRKELSKKSAPLGVKDQLRLAPSVEMWKAELESIFDGGRDHDIQRLGDITVHIEVLISGAEDSRLAERIFRDALNQVIEEWSPFRSRPSGYLYYVLSLIEGFTPKMGFVKLAGYLKEGSGFVGIYETPMGMTINFQTMALVSLGGYYPTPPPSPTEDSAYKSYLDILRINFCYSEYFPYVAVRLLDLHELSYDSIELRDGILRTPSALPRVVYSLFKHINFQTIAKNLSSIYSFCRMNKLEDQFFKSIEEFGRIEPQPLFEAGHNQQRHPSMYLVLTDDTRIEISLSAHQVQTEHPVTQNSLLEKLNTLIDKYRKARKAQKFVLAEAIKEEVTAIIELSLSPRSADFDYSELESALSSGGAMLQPDVDTDLFEFVIDNKYRIPIVMTPRQTLRALGEAPKGEEAWLAITELAEHRIH
jgi:hypothetical protein